MLALWLLLTWALSASLCWLYLLCARRWRWLAHPNERSSHMVATPHGGGVAIVMALVLVFVFCPVLDAPAQRALVVILVSTLVLAGVGVLDDLRPVPVRWRFFCYAICSGITVWLVAPVTTPMVVIAVAVVALLWLMNLYNFMDGIDGIAAIQAVLASAGAALLSWYVQGDSSFGRICAVFAAAQLGFLCWNWPPARLFMGDAGSIPTGYALGALGLLGNWSGALPLACWLILLACFIVDASYTLAARFLRGENVTQAHREHVYQRLSRHWHSHFRVDALLLMMALCWLLPLAAAAAIWPQWQILLVILAYIPLLVGMVKLSKLA